MKWHSPHSFPQKIKVHGVICTEYTSVEIEIISLLVANLESIDLNFYCTLILYVNLNFNQHLLLYFIERSRISCLVWLA